MRVNKKRDKAERVIIYSDEINDEFSSAVIEAKRIDGAYRYERTDGIRGLAHFFWYRIVAVPMAAVYLKLCMRHKIVGKEKLREYRRTGLFIYGNHTQAIADALIPTFIAYPRDAFVVVHANNVSMPFLGRITPYLGALPLPDDLAATRSFSEIIKKRNKSKKNIFIYPEAHIWPYYTHIRPFGEESFMYPVKYSAPVFCFTNVYKKKKHGKKPRVVSYIDGPFFADGALPPRERRRKLRDEVYSAMCLRAEGNEVEWIKYIRASDSTKAEETDKESHD